MSRLWTGLIAVVYIAWPELCFAQTIVAKQISTKTNQQQIISTDGRNAASAEERPNCNPEVYDRIYKAIVINSINGFFDDDFHDRNASIKALRELCFGQRSTFELDRITAAGS